MAPTSAHISLLNGASSRLFSVGAIRVVVEGVNVNFVGAFPVSLELFIKVSVSICSASPPRKEMGASGGSGKGSGTGSCGGAEFIEPHYVTYLFDILTQGFDDGFAFAIIADENFRHSFFPLCPL